MRETLMLNYGIKPVYLGWEDKVIGFSPKAYEKWKHDIRVGTRMLIYETRGSKGAGRIVAEVEVIAGFEASEGLPTHTKEHDQPVKVKTIHEKGMVSVIPLQKIRTI